VQSSRPSTSTQRPTRAPTTIDPAILRDRTFGEAPDLTERVRRGELPPVSERLPENPLVVTPMDTIGIYGGAIRRALTGDIVETAGVRKSINENLMGYERPLPNSIQLNLAERVAYQDGGRTAIIRIRKGIKWSDAAPFTVDDILFWYNDLIMDPDARRYSLPPTVWVADGEPIRMSKIDDYTIRVSSTRPLGRMREAFCGDHIALPKHIYARWHPRYNPNATYEDFRERTTNAQLTMKTGIPRVSPWIPVEWERGQRVIYERNPYYWKIDTAGNQLPYADRIEFAIIPDRQVILLKFINGELDLIGRTSQIDMYPTLRSEERKGNYELRVTGPERGPTLYINWDCPKGPLRQAFRDRRVRIALSIAIDREELSQLTFHGLLEPGGYSFGRRSPYFSESSYRKYTEFDQVRARELLEESGYVDSDGDGWREFYDGTAFELTIDVIPGTFAGACELVAAQWAAVGIKAHLNIILRNMIQPRRNNGNFDISCWTFEGPADPLGKLAHWSVTGPNEPFWHRTATDEGPEWLRRATDLISQAITTVDTTRLRTLMTEVRDLHTDNIPHIVLGFPFHVWGANTRLGNVPYQNTAASVHRGWARAIIHEQVYIK
jgi:peptide/nickel transport system substrate-binding protein